MPNLPNDCRKTARTSCLSFSLKKKSNEHVEKSKNRPKNASNKNDI